jgi:hypothetical protein
MKKLPSESKTACDQQQYCRAANDIVMLNNRQARSKARYLHCNSRVFGASTQGRATSTGPQFHGCDEQRFCNDAILGIIEFN